MRHDLLGRGWRFPFGFRSAGDGVATSEGEANVRQSISLILGTRPGERPMQPEFGCRAHEVLFTPDTQAAASLVAWHVRQALNRWEARVEVLDVIAAPGGDGRVRVEVRYRIRATASEHALTVPLGVGG